MELWQLRYFVAVAELLSFSKASRQLHLSTPALSQTIRRLEEEIGTRLFFRNRRIVVLTDVGRMALEGARDLLGRADIMLQSLQMATPGGTGLRIGVLGTLKKKVQIILAAYSKRFPGVDLRHFEMPPRSQQYLLAKGELDVAFITLSEAHIQLCFEQIFEDRIVILVNKASPLARRKPKHLRIADIAGHPLLLPPREVAAGFCDKVLQLYRSEKIAPVIREMPLDAFAGSALQTADVFSAWGKLQVARGKGIMLVPSRTDLHFPNVVHFTLKHPDARIGICMAWRKDENSTVVLGFLDFVRHFGTRLPRNTTAGLTAAP